MWLGLLSLHLIGIVGYNLLLRKSVLAKTDKWLLATILQTGICIPALVLIFFFPPPLAFTTVTEVLLFLSAIVLTILLQAFNVKSLQYLEASVFSVVYNTRIIIITFLGVLLLSETLAPVQIMGGLLIFCSVFIVRQEQSFHVTKQGLLFGFGAALVLSFLNITEKSLNQLVGFFEYFLPVSIICAVIMWTIVFLRRTPVSVAHLTKPETLSLMGFRALSAFGFSAAIVFGPVALSNYISSLSVILMVICGIVFLKERDYLKRKIMATIIASIGLSFILLT